MQSFLIIALAVRSHQISIQTFTTCKQTVLETWLDWGRSWDSLLILTSWKLESSQLHCFHVYIAMHCMHTVWWQCIKMGSTSESESASKDHCFWRTKSVLYQSIHLNSRARRRMERTVSPRRHLKRRHLEALLWKIYFTLQSVHHVPRKAKKAKKDKKESKKAKKLAKQIKKLEEEVERRKRQMNGEVKEWLFIGVLFFSFLFQSSLYPKTFLLYEQVS